LGRRSPGRRLRLKGADMADVNGFIDAIGKDVGATVAPRIETLIENIGAKAVGDYVPKLSAFANQLVKQIIDEQSVAVRDFATTLIQDLFARYRPELTGELHTQIVQDGLQLTGRAIALTLTRRDNGAPVSSLDIPVSIRIRVDPLGVTVQDATLTLDVVR
jgi:hypothetical protein